MKLGHVFAGAALSLTLAQAQATTIPLPGGVSILEDDNIEYVLDANGNLKTSGDLVAGDRLRAVITFQAVRNPDNSEFANLGEPGLEMTGISEIEIASIDALTGAITFKPSSSFESDFGTGAMASLYAHTPGDFKLECHTGGIATCETQASNGDHFFTLGFEDVDDFWIFNPLFGAAATDITTVGTSSGAQKFGTASYALSILENNSGYQFNEQFSSLSVFLGLGGDGFTDIIGSGDVLGGAGLTNGFFARSDFDFQVNRVPEPASLALLGLGMLGVRSLTRRKK